MVRYRHFQQPSRIGQKPTVHRDSSISDRPMTYDKSLSIELRKSTSFDTKEADPSILNASIHISQDDNTQQDITNSKNNVYNFGENCFLAWAKEQTAWKWDYIVKQYNARVTKENLLRNIKRPRRNRQAIEFHYRTLKQGKFSNKPEVGDILARR